MIYGVNPILSENNPVPAPDLVLEKSKAPRKISLRLVIIVLGVLLLAVLFYYSKSWFIAATVDGKPISRLAVIGRIEQQSGKAALDRLIDEHLIGREAKVKGVTDYMTNKDSTNLGSLAQYEPYYASSNYNVNQTRDVNETFATGGTVNRTGISETTNRTGSATTGGAQ